MVVVDGMMGCSGRIAYGVTEIVHREGGAVVVVVNYSSKNAFRNIPVVLQQGGERKTRREWRATFNFIVVIIIVDRRRRPLSWLSFWSYSIFIHFVSVDSGEGWRRGRIRSSGGGGGGIIVRFELSVVVKSLLFFDFVSVAHIFTTDDPSFFRDDE